MGVVVHEFTPEQACETDNSVTGAIAKVLNDMAPSPIAVTAYACQGNIYVIAVTP